MKKLSFILAFATLTLSSCCDMAQQQTEAMTIKNELSADEIANGKLSASAMWKMGRLGSMSLSPDAKYLAYNVTTYNMAENKGTSQIFVLDTQSGESKCLTDDQSSNNTAQWSSDGKSIYFLSDRSGENQLWKMGVAGENPVQITTVEGGIEAYGINAAEDKIFYTRKIHVADRKSSDIHKDMDKSKARIYDDLMARHWDYWDEGYYSHIFVAELTAEGLKNDKDILGIDAAWDAPLAPYFDAAEIAWSNDGTRLAYTCKQLTGTEYAVSTDSDIFIYDTRDGSTKNINKPTEQSKGEFVGYDRYPVWSPDDSLLAFCSMQTPGYESDKDRLFVYDVASGQMRYLTSEFDHSAQNVVWRDNSTIYFISPLFGTHQICKIAIPQQGETPRIETITRGDHDLSSMTLVGDKCYAARTTISSAAEIFAVDINGGELAQATDINGHIYKHIKMGEVQKRWIKTTDGKEMLTWVILPPDFDPNKKYPAILYCEGGPQSTVSNGWSYRWNFQAMAAEGYVVVAPNRRGCPSFGSEWREQISGDYAGQNIKDYLAAIDQVAKEPWVDTEHLGCVGASYGGYSVYYLAGHHEGRFKAFISHCGIFNFESMYGHTEELFFINHDYGGPYWEKQNKVAQRSYEGSPHNFVGNWDTPIMIVTGEYDFRIPYTQSLEAFTAARVRGIEARLVEFENEAHQVFKPQNSMVWYREFMGWLNKHLK